MTTRTRLAQFWRLPRTREPPADDLLVGRLIAEQGYEVELLPYAVLSVDDYGSMRELFVKRLRWDGSDAAHAPVGASRLAPHASLPWSHRGNSIAPDDTGSAELSRHVLCASNCDDLDDRRLGLKQSSGMEEYAASSGVGRNGVRHMASQFSNKTAFAGAADEYHIRDGMLVLASRSMGE